MARSRRLRQRFDDEPFEPRARRADPIDDGAARAEPVERAGAYAGIIPGIDDRPERDRCNIVTAATLQRE